MEQHAPPYHDGLYVYGLSYPDDASLYGRDGEPGDGRGWASELEEGAWRWRATVSQQSR